MFEDASDLEMQIPNYNVGFFISTSSEGKVTVWDCHVGDVYSCPMTDLRSIPDQDMLDNNELLRDLKVLFFKKEGQKAMTDGKDQIDLGGVVLYEEEPWTVMEIEPDGAVHLFNAGKILKVDKGKLRSVDADHQIQWTEKNETMEQFPKSLTKFCWTWFQNADTDELHFISSINSDRITCFSTITAKSMTIGYSLCRRVSEQFSTLLNKLPEFKRFRNAVMQGQDPEKIWKYRNLTTERSKTKALDRLDKEGIKARFLDEELKYGVKDEDLIDKVTQLEVAMNEEYNVVYDERDDLVKIVPDSLNPQNITHIKEEPVAKNTIFGGMGIMGILLLLLFL